jgi:pyrimidine-nucleoside phosphorylase
MNPVELIVKKRDGGAWTLEETQWFLQEYVRGSIPDYQVAAWAMAVYFRGMSIQETTDLAWVMAHSGRVLRWPAELHPLVDKHSTGGVGDKVSLILAPWLAACGVRVPMISGRGLGPTGGTLDKLEAIPGLRTRLTHEEFADVVARVGCAIVGASDDLVPADRKLYALRDVTGTVASVPLITASILSKKFAEGLDALVLDVKYGSGAFMKTRSQAEQLAHWLQEVAARLGLPTEAVLNDMSQPLGRKVGHALEVQEAMDVLQGKGPDDLLEVTRQLAVRALLLARLAGSPQAAQQMLDAARHSGNAWKKFQEMVHAQGGHLDDALPIAPCRPWNAPQSGTIVAMDAEQIGYALIDLGGGRRKQGDAIDHRAGFEFLAKVGDCVAAGQPIVLIYAPQDAAGLPQAEARLMHAIKIE